LNTVKQPYCLSACFLKWTILTVFLWSSKISAQTDTININFKKRQNLCYTIGLGGSTLVHAGLYQLWYKDYPSSSFHFINDNQQWLQMDKVGHTYSAYYLSYTGIEAAQWAGVLPKNQWKWGLLGMIFQTPIEVFDGFSAGWGASVGDLAANTLGSALCIGQHALWQEQKITMKFSYTPSSYAAMRPNVLGNSILSGLTKDYNGQTYWLCYSPLKNTKIDFLGIGLGYGANGLLGGTENKWLDQNKQWIDRTDLPRYRQYYLSLDYNLTKIKTNHKILKKILFVLNCIKLPSPAIEFSNQRLKAHLLKF
jgi:uncharacterized protein YfiM (DUF2279 family)